MSSGTLTMSRRGPQFPPAERAPLIPNAVIAIVVIVVAESMLFAGLIGACAQPGIQRLDEQLQGVTAARKAPAASEQSPRMVRVEGADQQWARVFDVFGHESATGEPSVVPEVGVVHSAQVCVVGYGDDVMASLP